MTHSNRKLSRRDFLKSGIITGLAALGGLVFGNKSGWLETLEKSSNPEWQITIDGRTVRQGRFVPGIRKDLYLPVQNGTAHIVLDGERIYVPEDNDVCIKKICHLMGSITRSGGTIICLPNKLVIRIL